MGVSSIHGPSLSPARRDGDFAAGQPRCAESLPHNADRRLLSMALIKTTALLLRSLRFGDTSRIVTVLTPEYGKWSAVAKGVRGPKSRFGASLEILTLSSLVVYYRRGRDLQLISDGLLDREFRTIVEEATRYPYGRDALDRLTCETRGASHLRVRLLERDHRMLPALEFRQADDPGVGAPIGCHDNTGSIDAARPPAASRNISRSRRWL